MPGAIVLHPPGEIGAKEVAGICVAPVFSGVFRARMDQMEDAMDFEAMFMEWDDYPLRQRLQMRVRSWRFHKGRMVRAYDDMMARMEAAMGEPYANSEDHWPAFDPRLPSVVNESLTGTFRRVWFSFLADQTSQEMLLAALALEDWQRKTSAFPEGLAELKDQRLEALPRDPFTDGSPLLYRREGEGYLLYSVGPDGRDDGGPAGGERRWFIEHPLCASAGS